MHCEYTMSQFGVSEISRRDNKKINEFQFLFSLPNTLLDCACFLKSIALLAHGVHWTGFNLYQRMKLA